MTLNIDQLKKKIIYRSNYRGTKEMDKLLGAFTKKYIETLDIKDLNDLEELLDVDDSNLYNFITVLNVILNLKKTILIRCLKILNIKIIK